ncbi:MAG TPA: hypothetical protein VFW78_02105 [Bacteroidia bacterium]|nr:hypothetical protein [Bacteroidia bacterium]
MTTNKRIVSMSDLQMEIALLETKKAVQEEKIRVGVKQLSENLKPANLVRNAIKSLGSDKELKSDLAKKGTEALAGFLISNLAFKNFGSATRTVASLIGTTVLSGLIGDEAGKYVEKIKNLIAKFKNNPQDGKTVFDEKDNYRQ